MVSRVQAAGFSPGAGRGVCVWAVMGAVLLALPRSEPSVYFSLARCKAVKRREKKKMVGHKERVQISGLKS